jgi:cysteinyl-tRNA synthetase
MADDRNTPQALAHAYEGTKEILGPDTLSAASARSAKAWLDRINELLGIVRSEYEERPGATEEQASSEFERQVEQLIEERAEARAGGNYERADQIRDQLEAMGVEVMDTPEGTEWRRTISI